VWLAGGKIMGLVMMKNSVDNVYRVRYNQDKIKKWGKENEKL